MSRTCEYCRQPPTPPWIYCQKEECARLSIAALVTGASRARRRKEREVVQQDFEERHALDVSRRVRCPLCKDRIADQPRSACIGCKTTYHNECLLELTGSRCSTIGCNRFVSTGAAPRRPAA